MGRTLTYPKLPNTTVKRKAYRGTYDLGAIHHIINTSNVVHVSFAADPNDPFPAILPMIGQMGSYKYPSSSLDDPMECYLHGYVSSRVMNLARREGKSEGLPVSISATHIDGLVLSLTPNSHSYNYRSAILHGYATVVEDTAEKLFAMEMITNSVLRNRYANTRVPPDGAEMSSTTILRVKVVGGSGKIRTGQANDDKKDTGREDVTSKVWTGVVPVYEVYGEPIPGPGNKVEKRPAYIDDFITDMNTSNEAKAKAQAEE